MIRIRTTVHEDAAALDALAPRWRALLDRAASPEPTQTPLWLRTWWREFGGQEGRKLRVLALEEDDGHLVAIAPLVARRALQKRVVPFARLELLASGEDEADEICSNYIGVICEAGREDDVARELTRALVHGDAGPWQELVLSSMNGSLAFVAALERALVAASIRVTRTPCGRCPFVSLPRTWGAYLEGLHARQRAGILRALADLEASAGGPRGYTLHRASTEGELEIARAILVRLHAEDRVAHGAHSAFGSARFSRFHQAIMESLFHGNDGELDLLWLAVGETPIGALYNIVYRGKTYVYQSGFSASAIRLPDTPNAPNPRDAVGLAMHALAIRRAIEHGMREYDFLQGAASYEDALCSDAHPLVELRAVAPSLRARVLETARVAAETVHARVRR